MNKKKSRLLQNRVLTKGFLILAEIDRNMPFSFQPKPKLMQNFFFTFGQYQNRNDSLCECCISSKGISEFLYQNLKELLLG